MSIVRTITFREAIREALEQAMSRNSKVFLMGCGVASPTRIFGSIDRITERFGECRVMEVPVAENGMAGIAIGAALTGMHPVLIYQRIDFALLAMDQIVNHAAKWSYMCGSKHGVPLTIRGIIGRRWGQGAQHSQSLQSFFVHVPGLKVVMPSTPFDAKGLLISSLRDRNPVIFLEHRLLYESLGRVPSTYYQVPFGKGRIVRSGTDITLVAVSLMVSQAQEAAKILKSSAGIEVEIIDPRSLKPLDEEMILKSVRKTGRLLVADTGWRGCGFSSEVAALVAEKGFGYLRAPVRRLTLPDAPTPTSVTLENAYYPDTQDIVRAVFEVVAVGKKRLFTRTKAHRAVSSETPFTGPF